MRSRWKRISILCAVLGLLCIIAAGLFAFYNMYDDSRAGRELKAETERLEALVLSPERAREQALEKQREEILRAYETFDPAAPTVPPSAAPVSTAASGPDATDGANMPAPQPTADPDRMPVIRTDGTDYVAILSIPALDLELVVRNESTKAGLKQSPCRYVGSVYTDDLIICAHNYTSHFGRLKELNPGDEVLLVDMDGVLYTYHVEQIEEVSPFAISYMVESDYPLTLFTCTIGGKARVTVRCVRDS